MTAPRRLTFWLIAALVPATVLGCARSSGATSASDPASPGAPAPGAHREPPRPGEPTVTRSTLLAILDLGPGALLHDLFQDLEVTAHFEAGAFAGWQIVALAEGADRYDAVGLRQGDVVRSVNGYRIERPEYLSAIFAELRDAAAILIEVERAGESFEVRIVVVED
jgi:hypothetical protein